MNFTNVKLSSLGLWASLLWMLCAIPIFSQTRPRVTVADKRAIVPGLPFAINEELTFKVELSKLLLRGIDVGELTFKVENEPNAGDEFHRLRFVGSANSKGVLTKLFGLTFRQQITTTVEATSLDPLFSYKEDIQGKRARFSQTTYDQQANHLTWVEQNPQAANNPQRTLTTPFERGVQDLSSVWYHLRAIKKFQPGTTIELQIADSGHVYRIPVRVVERKKINTVLGKVMTVRLDPQIFGDDRLVGGEGEMSLWLTDDARRAPVKAIFSNKLGRLNITLESARNLVPMKK